jgi:hypothetical protein
MNSRNMSVKEVEVLCACVMIYLVHAPFQITVIIETRITDFINLVNEI